MSDRGYDVHCDAVMVKDITEELVSRYDIFTPIAKLTWDLRCQFP